MPKYHNCSICNMDLKSSTTYGFKRGVYLGKRTRICKECYNMIPYHIPPQQIKRYVERLVKGKR
jgi:hypothetical protein